MKSKYEEKRNREIDSKIYEKELEISFNQEKLIEAIKNKKSNDEIEELISERNSLCCDLNSLEKQKEFIRMTKKQLGKPIIDYTYSGQIVTNERI